MYRLSNILQRQFAEITKGQWERLLGVIVDASRDAEAAWLANTLEPCCDVDAITKDVMAIDDDVADIDPDAELEPFLGPLGRIALRHAALYLDRTAHRLHDARKLDKHAIAGGFDDATTMLADLWIDQGAPARLESGQGAFLVLPHQTRVTRHVGGEDGGQLAFDALGRHGKPSLPYV
jgi:hypothetical protein